jgi:UDP-3-O-[3-hydroxymyristoyl] N-acetylglucosamine deacetylase
MRLAAIAGQGLHTGARGAVEFERREGAVVLRAGSAEIGIDALEIVATNRSTTVASPDGNIRFATIEHVLAALAGLGIHGGVTVVIEGSEAPLADGGARRYADAIASLGVAPTPPRLRVARDGSVDVGTSRYELRCNDPGDEAISVEVVVDFDRPGLVSTAHWAGDAEDFRTRIAVARTFGFEHEVEELLARGLASHVTPESVVVIGEQRILSSGAPFTPDEPARHKLLDLVGDLYLHGGPPIGKIRAVRPGHAATHEAMRRALAQGLVTRDRAATMP